MSNDISVELIDADPDQPRKYFSEAKLAELADSLSANGQAVAILVRPVGDRFMIVHGERRWRAAKNLGWATIRAEVRNDLDRAGAQWLSLVENMQRADLTPIEEAAAFRSILDGGVTQTQLAKKIGKTQSYIAHKLNLLKLPGPIRFYLERGKLTENHVRQLMKIKGWIGGPTIDFTGAATTFESWRRDGYKDRDAHVFYFMIRPAERMPWYAQQINDKQAPEVGRLLVDAVRAYADWVAECDYRPPVWASHAFWFASMVVGESVTVALLNNQLDAWWHVIASAVVMIPIDDKLPDEVPAKVRFGHIADIRHARLDAKNASLRREAIAKTLEGHDILMPSAVVFGDQNDLIEPIDSGLNDTKKALKEIRDRELYRGTHDSYEEYVADRWGQEVGAIEILP